MANVNIHGSKNAALPIIAGTLLEKKIYYLKNIPLINDIYTQLAILKQFNVHITWLNQEDLIIDTTNLKIPANINYDANCRGTYYFIGSTVAYNVDLQFTIANGCDIDNRKYDYHLELLALLGKTVTFQERHQILVTGQCVEQKLTYTFPKPSVGATINALFMFGKAKYLVILNNYAKDPYIIDTIHFLQELGFNIVYNEYTIFLHGYQENPKPIIQYTIIEDTIEAITYIIYSGINLKAKSRSTYTIGPVNTNYMGKTYALLCASGLELIESEQKNYYYIYRPDLLRPFHITTGYYPAIYTDIQPFLCLLALYTSADTATESNNSTITEMIWNDRFK